MMWSHGWGGTGWVWFSLMHIVWWLLIIVGIVALIRWGLGSNMPSGRRTEEGRALEILRERYACGEIGKEEFEERKRVLKG